MAIIKCKMCGGDLDISGSESVAVCEYCGTKQTLPRLDDERRRNLYDRAGHFRRANNYDKAAAIYEQILNEDRTDAEAYWSLVLCKYGIEYVEDPASHRRLPTVNRMQYTSILADEDYKSALTYADDAQREVYESEAHAIDEIQGDILAISQQEEPFDVFICYKETDANGRRTPDSVLATELYHGLVREGLKVFFARITLEDKLGTEYEPYIFAALHSARVMVVLGTRAEYFNAVWVKNEWSRYLGLIRSGAEKTLIPAYRDMDPYDLPDEFSHLQAQDMAKLGFMQDLIRGVKKILGEETVTPAGETAAAQQNGPKMTALVKRAYLFLDEGSFEEADAYCERALDQDPENVQAYLCKLLAAQRVKTKEELKDCPQPFDDTIAYKRVMRFADDSLKEELENCNDFIRKNTLYRKAVQAMDQAASEAAYEEAARQFQAISEYNDAAEQAELCLEKAANLYRDTIYNRARSDLQVASTVQQCEEAMRGFKSILGWRDSEQKIAECQKRIEEFRAREQAAMKRAAVVRVLKRTATLLAVIVIGVILVSALFPAIANH